MCLQPIATFHPLHPRLGGLNSAGDAIVSNPPGTYEETMPIDAILWGYFSSPTKSLFPTRMPLIGFWCSGRRTARL
jgi:hypothetical protein